MSFMSDAQEGLEEYNVQDGLLQIEITGSEYEWHVRHPGPDGLLDTEDDVLVLRDLRVPLGRRVKVLLLSHDYIYTFALPLMDLKQIAVPDLMFSIEFQAERLGRFDLLGDQMCGYTHPRLLGNLVITSEEDYESWLVVDRAGKTIR